MDATNFKKDFYKRAYVYALAVIEFADKLPKDFSSGILGHQLVRSGTSVSANLVEAKSASSKKDYINFYQHALKSANESKLWIGLLRDSKRSDIQSAEKLLQETGELASILAASILTMKGKK